jgi:hypothetical protein
MAKVASPLLLALCLGLAGCDAGERYPAGDPGGTGGTGGTGGRRDAGGDGGGGVGGITGRVCRTNDIRDFGQCAPVAGVTVAVRQFATETATTGSDGTFSLRAQPQADVIDLVVTDPQGLLYPGARVTPLRSGEAKDVIVTVISKALAVQIIADSAFVQPDTTGLLAVSIAANADPLANAVFGPAGASDPLYDVGNETTFLPGVTTSVLGFVLYPNVSPDAVDHTRTISVTSAGVTKAKKVGVVNGFLTFTALVF